MRRTRQTGLACTLALLGLGTALAAPSLTLELDPPSPRVGQSATLKIICTGAAPRTVQQERATPGVGLRYLGESTEFVIVDGLRSAKKTFRYQFTPATEGQFVMPAFTTTVNGRPLRAAPLKVTVRGRDGTPATGPADGNPTAYLRVHPPTQTNLFAGEMFGLGVGLYYQNGREPLVPQIRAEGVRYLLSRPKQRTGQLTRLGAIYTAHLFTNTAVASKPGPLPIFFETDLTVFDLSRNQFGEKRIIHLVSDTVTLNIQPLPEEGQPANFTGAVGEFNLDVTAGPTQNLTAGDPLTLKILISGTGPLDDLPDPDTSAWNGFKVYNTKRRLQHIDSLGRNAILTITQLIAPLHTGVAAIPALEFSFFDPKAAQYRTVRSKPIPLQVESGPAALPESARLPKADAGGPVEAVPSLRDIKRKPGMLSKIAPPLLLRPWFWAAPGAPLLAWLGLLLWRRREAWLAAHPEVIRRRQVARRVSQGLRQLPQLQGAEFYRGAHQLLQEQIGERLDLPAKGITGTILDHPKAISLPTDTRRQLAILFAACDQARFTPRQGTANRDAFLGDLKAVLYALQRLPAHA